MEEAKAGGKRAVETRVNIVVCQVGTEKVVAQQARVLNEATERGLHSRLW